MHLIPAEALTPFARNLLAAGGASPDEADCIARSLVGANLRGYESHGVMRIPYYVDSLAQGESVSGADLTIVNESPAHLTADANWGLGQVQAGRLLDRLSSKTRQGGLAVGSMIHSSHIGRLGELKVKGGPGYDHLLRNFLPKLRQAGFDEDAIRQMLVQNPARILAIDAG